MNIVWRISRSICLWKRKGSPLDPAKHTALSIITLLNTNLARSDARGLQKQPAGYTVRVPEWGWHARRHKRGIETDRYHARHLDSVLYRPPRSVRPHLPTDYEDDYED